MIQYYRLTDSFFIKISACFIIIKHKCTVMCLTVHLFCQFVNEIFLSVVARGIFAFFTVFFGFFFGNLGAGFHLTAYPLGGRKGIFSDFD